MSRHIAAPSALMLAAEEVEESTCSARLDAGAEIPVFDTGRHCAPFPTMCVMGSDAHGTFIDHACGLGVERVAAIA